MERIYGTIQENFELALREDAVKELCGPLDPYYRMACQNVEYYLECAAALERGETHILVTRRMR